MKYYVKKKFIGKYAENVHQKKVLDLILVNNPKYSQCIEDTLVNKIFWYKVIRNSRKT